ncbi:MAG: hypothetical protein ACXVBV_19345 [Isosphaeraceae bacterium]
MRTCAWFPEDIERRKTATKNPIPAVLVGLLALAIHQRADSTTQAPSKATSADEVVADTYEHLATAIIEIEATEDNLV